MLSTFDKPIAVLMTSHNRREKTLECLRRLFAQEAAPSFDVYLVDDASTDGTAEAVTRSYPNVHLIKGNGSLFWAGGMRLAWQEAAKRSYAAYVWLNDDVQLDPEALNRLWSAHTNGSGDAVLGGAMRDEIGKVSYAGSVRTGIHPFRYRLVEPDSAELQEVDVLHGNLVIVPSDVHRKIGGFAPYLVHRGGDYEYCQRAKRHGYKSLLLPGTFGICPRNETQKPLRGAKGLRKAMSPKSLPISMAIPLYRESAGPFWWFWLATFYVKAFTRGY